MVYIVHDIQVAWTFFYCNIYVWQMFAFWATVCFHKVLLRCIKKRAFSCTINIVNILKWIQLHEKLIVSENTGWIIPIWTVHCHPAPKLLSSHVACLKLFWLFGKILCLRASSQHCCSIQRLCSQGQNEIERWSYVLINMMQFNKWNEYN